MDRSAGRGRWRRLMRELALTLVALGAWSAAPGAHAQGDDAAAAPPSLDFLEYLGSWQAKDDEWYEIAEWDKDNPKREDSSDQADKARDGKGKEDNRKGGGELRKPEPAAPPTEERP